MKKSISLCLFFLFVFSANIEAQERRRSFVTVKGEIKNHKDEVLKNAQIFVDMIKTDVETNKKGKYKIKIGPKNNLITVYHKKYGFINWKYNGERKVDFVYPEDADALSQKDMEALGFDFKVRKIKDNYGSYASVMDILTGRFRNVRIDSNGSLIIGRRGPSTVTSDPNPLLLVNDMPMAMSELDMISTQEIKSIRVLDKPDQTGSYGIRGANGVILIKLKNGEEEKS